MEKIIFFGLVIPIFAFVLYLGANAIMKGTEAKNALKEQDNLNNEENENFFDNKNNLSEELDKLNNLLKDGFSMMQYSVYVRHCASSESADVHEKRIHNLLPPLGKVSVLRITDKQFGNILNVWGKAEVPKAPQPTQLELF